MRDLKQEAEQALAAGQIERALEAYQQLELTFQTEPSWSRQVAQLHSRLGDDRACIEALVRAADRCAARREPIKVIAACKLIQALDPDNERARILIDDIIGPQAVDPIPPAPTEIDEIFLPLRHERSEKGALQL